MNKKDQKPFPIIIPPKDAPPIDLKKCKGKPKGKKK